MKIELFNDVVPKTVENFRCGFAYVFVNVVLKPHFVTFHTDNFVLGNTRRIACLSVTRTAPFTASLKIS